jgi:hypothetical protein
MEKYQILYFIGLLLGTLVFFIKPLRFTTKIITYFTVVFSGFVIAGLTKFNASFSDGKDLIMYLALLVLLCLIAILKDLNIILKNK